MRIITVRQLEVLHFIEGFIKDNGYSPTIREIGKHFRVSAKGAYDHVIALEKKGYVTYQTGKLRTLRIIEKKQGGEA